MFTYVGSTRYAVRTVTCTMCVYERYRPGSDCNKCGALFFERIYFADSQRPAIAIRRLSVRRQYKSLTRLAIRGYY